jgi:hypothetical protein
MSLVIGQTAQAVGPVYTVPAEYDKMVKAVEGLLGKDLDSVNSTQAQNIGANIRSFVEGATGKSVSSTYSPSYFSAYGNNYRQFVTNAAGTDPGATTSATNFTNAGRNYRNLAQGMTGLGITDSRYYYYNYAGQNYRSVAQGLADGQPITTSPTYYASNYQQTKIQQFKQRADQTFYDMYINPDGIKKAFTTMDTTVTTKTAGLTPITTSNKAEFVSGGLDDTFVIGCLPQNDSNGGIFTVTCTISFTRDYSPTEILYVKFGRPEWYSPLYIERLQKATNLQLDGHIINVSNFSSNIITGATPYLYTYALVYIDGKNVAKIKISPIISTLDGTAFEEISDITVSLKYNMLNVKSIKPIELR